MVATCKCLYDRRPVLIVLSSNPYSNCPEINYKEKNNGMQNKHPLLKIIYYNITYKYSIIIVIVINHVMSHDCHVNKITNNKSHDDNNIIRSSYSRSHKNTIKIAIFKMTKIRSKL